MRFGPKKESHRGVDWSTRIPEIRVGVVTLESGGRAESPEPGEGTQSERVRTTTQSCRHRRWKKRLDAEAGDQRVKRWLGFRTSSRPGSYRTATRQESRRDNIERYFRNRGLNSIITVLQRSQNAVAGLPGTRSQSRTSDACAVGGSMFAHWAMALRHSGHAARGRHGRHALASRHAKPSRHLPDY